MTFTNDLEIRIFGMRRSGNHAVINWLGSQAPSKPHYFNCASNRGHSPFVTGKGRGDDKDERLEGIWYPHPKYKHVDEKTLTEVREMKKEILMYSYEDLDLAKMDDMEFPEDREKTVGKSRRKLDIVILRDFPNWLASKVVIREDKVGGEFGDFSNWQNLTYDRFEKNRKTLPFFEYYDGWEEDALHVRGLNYINSPKTIKAWRHYAEQMLGKRDWLENPIYILFNRWHTDKEYRRDIIERVGFEFTDATKDVVSPVGGGSSFEDATTARNLALFDRWRHFIGNRIFDNLVKYHKQELKYNKKLFGDCPELGYWETYA